MPNCIACDGYFEPNSKTGARCGRCGTDNRAWLHWQYRSPIEQGGWRGIEAFTRPHAYIPLVVTAFSTLFGLLAAFTLWEEIRPGFRLLTLLVVSVGCLISIQGMYEERLAFRKHELLRRVRRGRRKGLSARAITLLLPAVAAVIVLILTYELMQGGWLWSLVEWLALSEAPEMGESTPQRVAAVLPFVLLMAYTILAISFTASSSLMLVREYIRLLDRRLPAPIFMQDVKLAEIVRREAEIVLGRIDPLTLNPQGSNDTWMGYLELIEKNAPRPVLPDSVGMSVTSGGRSSPQLELWNQAASWVWDELARTDDGGIELRVARQEMYFFPPSAADGSHPPGPRVCYTVRADHWGRIIRITRV